MTRRKASKGNVNVEDVFSKSDLINNSAPTKVKIKCKTQNQKAYATLIEQHEIIICDGPSGVGKSFVAIGKALELLQSENSPFKKLIIVNPNVVAGHSASGYGHIKGTLREKLEPLASASLDVIDKLISERQRKKLEDEGIIKLDSIVYLRGKSVDNAILILEEAQNTTPSEIKTLITRIGNNSKFIISGDLEQSDLFSDNKKTGLYDAMQRFKNVDEIKTFSFEVDDVVRNPIITKILKLYTKEEIPTTQHKPILLTEERVKNKSNKVNKGISNPRNILNKISNLFKW